MSKNEQNFISRKFLFSRKCSFTRNLILKNCEEAFSKLFFTKVFAKIFISIFVFAKILASIFVTFRKIFRKKRNKIIAKIRKRKFCFNPISWYFVSSWFIFLYLLFPWLCPIKAVCESFSLSWNFKMPDYWNAAEKFSPASLVLPLVRCVSPASAFRHLPQSGTAGHGLFR
jgi:hypothetical protein